MRNTWTDSRRRGRQQVTEVKDKTNRNIEVNNCENKLEWILDSGCSDHIIIDDKYFTKVKKLENPIDVKVGD